MSNAEIATKSVADAKDRMRIGRWRSFGASVAMPAILLSALLGIKLPGKRDQRGVTTVEYIFGALIGIAIVGCIAALFTSGAMDKATAGILKWIFGQRVTKS